MASFQRVIWMGKAASAAIMLLAMVSIIWTAGPWIETKYFPVVDKLHISDVQPGPYPGSIQFTAEFVKLRACEYLGLGWYHEENGGQPSRVNTILLRNLTDSDGPTRPPGYTKTGPWIVYMTEDELLHHSFAVLYHRCNPLWVTTTEFYP